MLQTLNPADLPAADTQQPERSAGRHGSPARDVGIGMAVTFVVTFLLRFDTAEFLNDHFTHLSRAREIVHGELPIRDFFDPGQFLHYFMSAGAQIVFGYNLFGETLLTVFFIALATAVTYGLSWRLSRSHLVASAVTLLTVVSYPRLYNYPKVILYAVVVWVMWWYAHKPERSRIRVLAAFTVLAFLFRYDHGIYIGVLTLLVQGIVFFRRPKQFLVSSGVYATLCFAMLIPFMIYVQWAIGLRAYVTASLAPMRLVGRRVGSRNRVQFSSLDDWNAALSRTIGPRQEGEDNKPLARFEELFHNEALSSFYALSIALPFVALVMVWWSWYRGAIGPPEAAVIAALSVFCALLWRTMMVDNPDARLADISPPLAILGAWVGGRWLAPVWSGSFGPRARRLIRTGVAVVFVFTLWSVSTQAAFLTTLERYHIIGTPRDAAEEFVNTYNRLRVRPINDWAQGDEIVGIRVLGRYVMRCTEPDDRLLIGGRFAPEVFFYTERQFAGGQVHFMRPWHASLPEQRLTIKRLQAQNVPIVLLGDRNGFERDFPFVAEYMKTRFVEVAADSFGDYPMWHVLVDRRLTPTSVDSRLGLPCFRRSPEN